MPAPETYTEFLRKQRDIRKVLVLELPDGTHIEVASDIENIDALCGVFAKLREADDEGTRAIFGTGWTFELDTMARYVNSDDKVIMEHDDPVSFPSPEMRGMVPSDDEDAPDDPAP